MIYRQTILVRYLSGFVEEIKTECHEKGHFIRSIWNALIKIFEELFERVVAESKSKERKMLRDEIKIHNDYQGKIEELMSTNDALLQHEDKYRQSIGQLMDSIAEHNVELKGTKSLQEKSAVAARQMCQKYEELKTDYLDLIMQGGMSREEAEGHLHDKELFLFSKQIGHKELDVVVIPKTKRKARVIRESIDVGLIL